MQEIELKFSMILFLINSISSITYANKLLLNWHIFFTQVLG